MTQSSKEHRHEYYLKNKERLNANSKRYNDANKERISQSNRERYRKTHPLPIPKRSRDYKTLRNDFICLYGGKCSCCGETALEFLTIEHVLGQAGRKRETSRKAYSNALKEYRPDIYAILCMNCNHSRGKYGYCPHKGK